MRQLLPTAVSEVDTVALHAADQRPPRPDRPWLIVNMITTLDGATAVDGVSGGLGGPADKIVFGALRSIADVILVAAGTVRAEHYGPPNLAGDRRRERAERRQAPVPRLAIVSHTLDLEETGPLFAEAEEPPIVLTTTTAPPARRAALEPVARVATFGTTTVDLPAALAWLRTEIGAAVVLCEGGPTLNGALIAADVVDEWCLTLSPLLAGGSAARAAHGDPSSTVPLRIDRVLEGDGLLFVRSVRA